MTGGPRALRVSGHGARRSVLALAAAALLATSPAAQEPPTPAPAAGAQAAPVELGPVIHDEVNGFEIRPIAGGTAEPAKQSWVKLVYRVPATHGEGIIVVGLSDAGMTANNLFALIRKEYTASGWTVQDETAAATAGDGAEARLQLRRDRDGVVERNFLYARHGRVWRLMISHHTRDEAVWVHRTAALLPAFKILGPPIDPAAAPVLEGGKPFDDPAWGVSFPLPKDAEIQRDRPAWAALGWKCPQADKGWGLVNVAFGEHGESARSFRQFLRRQFEAEGFAPASEGLAPEATRGADEVFVLRRASDAVVQRVHLWARPTWTMAVIFCYTASGARAWDRFAGQLLAKLKIAGPPRSRPERVPGTDLGDPVQDRAFGAIFRMPRSCVAATANDPETQRAFNFRRADGTWEVFTITKGADGTSAAELLQQLVDSHADFATLRGREARPDALLGTDGYLRMDPVKDKSEIHFFFVQGPGQAYGLSFCLAAGDFDRLRRAIYGVILAFRVNAAPDSRLAAPEGPVHETAGVWCQTEHKQVPTKALQAVAETMQAALDAAREWTGGPAPRSKLRAHVYSDDELQRRVGKAVAAGLPSAQYVPEGRFVLVRAPTGKLEPTQVLELQRGAFSAYRDAWLGTPHGIPPWIVAGIEEAIRIPKRAGPGAALAAEPDLKRSPLADWIKKNRKTATWPAVDRFVRTHRSPAGEAERAYALALLLACARAEAPAAKGLVGTLFARFQARGDPEEAMDDAYDGVDFAKLDAAARALLAELK